MSKIYDAPIPNKVSPRTKWTYTLGGVGRDMAYTLYSTYLLTFILFTKGVTDVQFGVISTILIVCRIWDAINDPVMGGIIENTKSKMGKFKPWILIGVLSNALILSLIFSLPLDGWNFVIFFGVMYLLWDITFTMNDIAYWSMLPSLSSNPKERATLTSMANLFAGLGGVLAVALTPLLTQGPNAIGGNAVTGYMAVAIIISAIFIGCQVMTVVGVKESPRAIKLQQKAEPIGLKKMMKIIFGNKQLLWLALVMLMYNIGSSVVLAFGTTYIYFEFGYDGLFVTILAVVFAVGGGAINVIYPKFAEKINRKEQQFISIILIAVGYTLFFLNGVLWKADRAVEFVLLCVALVILAFGQGIYYMNLTINLSNTIEYNDLMTGSRNEGIIFAMRPFMAKLGSAMQQFFIMIVYIILGITTITNAISDVEKDMAKGLIDETVKGSRIEAIIKNVDDTTTLGLKICMVGLPLILLAVGYFVLKYKFKIDEKTYSDILKKLAERDAQRALEEEAALNADADEAVSAE
ncbi:MAG: glycoside-pentoside-hexuronide (GPH):cation symporter [Clostridia bacterium]